MMPFGHPKVEPNIDTKVATKANITSTRNNSKTYCNNPPLMMPFGHPKVTTK
jgi:hypothetical protein